MNKCPGNLNAETCGLEGAQYLVRHKYVSLNPNDSIQPINISVRGARVEKTLQMRHVDWEGASAVATFGCSACSQCIEIVDDGGTMSARLASQYEACIL